MSMFLIQCHELNNRLIYECEELVKYIVKNIYDVNLDEATQVIAEVKKITEAFSLTAKVSHELVEYEASLEEIRSVTRASIVSRYTSLIEWVDLMY